jgi:hypothetical protein
MIEEHESRIHCTPGAANISTANAQREVQTRGTENDREKRMSKQSIQEER